MDFLSAGLCRRICGQVASTELNKSQGNEYPLGPRASSSLWELASF